MIAGMWIFIGIKRPVLHPDAQAVPSLTQTAAPQRSEAIDRARRLIRAAVVEQNLPGVSVAVGAGGDLVWAEGFGWADVETHAPISPDTRFRIGTASTVLTSAAVGLLLDRGRLKLDDEIQTYVPQYPKKQWPVTLRQLMAHDSGLATDSGEDGPLFRRRCEQPADAVRLFAGDPLLFEPGTQYRPSKFGWVLVSAAVGSAAGQPFHAFLRDQVFHPLRMDQTGADSASEENPDRLGDPEEDPPLFNFIHDVLLQPLGITDGTVAAKLRDRATLYRPGFGPSPVFRYGVHHMRLRNVSCYAGSLAYLSTPSDLVRLGLALNGSTLLRPDTARLLQTPQKLASGQETGAGLGWELGTVPLAGRTVRTAGFDGELLGQRVVSFWIYRDTGIVVALMSNLSSADTSALALQVAEAFTQPRP